MNESLKREAARQLAEGVDPETLLNHVIESATLLERKRCVEIVLISAGDLLSAEEGRLRASIVAAIKGNL